MSDDETFKQTMRGLIMIRSARNYLISTRTLDDSLREAARILAMAHSQVGREIIREIDSKTEARRVSVV